MNKNRKKYEKTLRGVVSGPDYGYVRVEKFKKISKKKRLSPQKYLNKYQIDSRIKLAKTYLKNKNINFKNSEDLEKLLHWMQIELHDSFKYICEGILRSNKRKIKHIFEDEKWTYDNPQTELIELYYKKSRESKKKDLPSYTIKKLFKDPETEKWFEKYMKIHDVKFNSYIQFYKFFVDWKYTYESLNDLLPKSK